MLGQTSYNSFSNSWYWAYTLFLLPLIPHPDFLDIYVIWFFLLEPNWHFSQLSWTGSQKDLWTDSFSPVWPTSALWKAFCILHPSSSERVYWSHCVWSVLVIQLCPSLCDLMDCNQPGSSVHGISQARILEWVAISFSRGASWPRDRTWVSCIAGRFFTARATREARSQYYWVYPLQWQRACQAISFWPSRFSKGGVRPKSFTLHPSHHCSLNNPAESTLTRLKVKGQASFPPSLFWESLGYTAWLFLKKAS